MRLKYVFIKEYKNLKDFDISFDGSSFIDVFVGKNGSGKSNFFEALINIFHHLQDDEDTRFEYMIVYEIDEKDYKIEWKEKKRFINDKEQKSFPKTLLPDNVIVYYSGHNKQVSNLIKQYEASFSKKIKGANLEDSRFFIGVGSEYKNILLTLLLIQDSTNKASNHLKTKMKIKAITSYFNLILKRPNFANKRLKDLGFESIDNFEEKSHYWGADGITFDLLKQLEKCINIKDGFNHGDIYNPEKDEYTLPIDIELFQKEFEALSMIEKFRMFDNLKTLDMLKGISIGLELEDGTHIGIEEFSDGQFQSIYIYAVTEIFKELNCLTLLDEPDAFLHPEWQQMFFDQISHIISDSVNNHILMTTHSASTLIPFDDSNINLFCITDSKVIWTKQGKKETINELANHYIQYSEDESKLLIDNVIRTSSKPILFVEGVSDVDILNTAYKKLYSTNDMPILVQDAFDRGFIRTLLSRSTTYTLHPNKKFFGLFDFDDAYEDWRKLGSSNEETDIEKGLCRKINNQEAYVFLLPIPNNDLKQQVWDEVNPTEKIVPKPHFCIEHIFWDSFEDKSTWFREKNGVKYFKGDSHKVRFAKEIVPSLAPESFEVFRPIFELIKSKCIGN